MFFWLCHVACGILFQIREEPVPPSVESQSPNHWTAKGIPSIIVIKQIYNIYFHNLKSHHNDKDMHHKWIAPHPHN